MLIALLKMHEALFKVRERGKIVRSEYLSLNDGEIDFNLVDQAGMNGSVYKKSVGPSGSNAFHCFLTAMGASAMAAALLIISFVIFFAPCASACAHSTPGNTSFRCSQATDEHCGV